MADESPISPVDAVRADAVEASDEASPADAAAPSDDAPPVDDARPRGSAGSSGDRGAAFEPPTLGVGLEHEQLEHPVHPPGGVDATATIHESAAHGDPIALAIERARGHEPSDRAQTLGGAAASAASGQAAQIELTGAGDEGLGEGDTFDPFAPVDSVTDERRGDVDTGRPGG